MTEAQSNAHEASPRRKLVGHLFRKGVSGNPGGRPRSDPQVRELARQYGAEAIAKLVSLMRGKDSRIALAAAEALLDRGFGKPTQAVTGINGPLVEVNIGAQPGQPLSPEQAYRAMIEGVIPDRISRRGSLACTIAAEGHSPTRTEVGHALGSHLGSCGPCLQHRRSDRTAEVYSGPERGFTAISRATSVVEIGDAGHAPAIQDAGLRLSNVVGALALGFVLQLIDLLTT